MESSNSNSKERELQLTQRLAKQRHSICMTWFEQLETHLHDLYLLNSPYAVDAFKPAFRSFFGEEHQTFKLKMFHNLDQLRLQLERENLHGVNAKTCLQALRTQFKEFLASKGVNATDLLNQGWQQDFEDFTRCEPSAYRRELLENLDTLEAVIHRVVNTYGVLRMKENELNALKENGSQLHDEILHEHQIKSSVKMQSQDIQINPVQAMDDSLIVSKMKHLLDKGQEIAKPVTPQSGGQLPEEDSDLNKLRGRRTCKRIGTPCKAISKAYQPTNNNLRTSLNTPGNKLKIPHTMCSDCKPGASDWLADTDEEIDGTRIGSTIISFHGKIQIVQLILFIVDSGCTKHMTGNLKLLCNFVDKFLGLFLRTKGRSDYDKIMNPCPKTNVVPTAEKDRFRHNIGLEYLFCPLLEGTITIQAHVARLETVRIFVAQQTQAFSVAGSCPDACTRKSTSRGIQFLGDKLVTWMSKKQNCTAMSLAEAEIFKGYKIDPSTTLSHLFYADDAVFIGEWSHSNLKGIMNILRCFSLLSGMSINIQKSHLLGVGIPDNCVAEAANCDETINKMKKRLSRWKLNTLSVGGRLTLLKSVLGSTPIYNMSIFKVPKSVLNYMESLRRNFFNGFQEGDRKIAWVKWSKVLASKKFGGLGVSSFFALNRALLFKWVWRYLFRITPYGHEFYISLDMRLNGHGSFCFFQFDMELIKTRS
ncbi:hypothetical protein Tco_0764859 [Tanacetum coccineum]